MTRFVDYEDELYLRRWSRQAAHKWREVMKPICHGSGGYASGHYKAAPIEEVAEDFPIEQVMMCEALTVMVRAALLITGAAGVTVAAALWWLL